MLELQKRELLRIQHFYDKKIQIKGFGNIEAYVIDRGLYITARATKLVTDLQSDQKS